MTARTIHALRILLLCLVPLMLGACGGQVELLSQVSESQANDVLGALIKRGVAAEKVAGKEGRVNAATFSQDELRRRGER